MAFYGKLKHLMRVSNIAKIPTPGLMERVEEKMAPLVKIATGERAVIPFLTLKILMKQNFARIQIGVFQPEMSLNQ